MPRVGASVLLALILTSCTESSAPVGEVQPPGTGTPEPTPSTTHKLLTPRTASACAPASGHVVVVTVNPDTPVPRCWILRAHQQIRVVNETTLNGQPGARVVATLGAWTSDVLEPGESFTFARPVGLAFPPGYHRLKLNVGGLHWVTEILLPKMPCDPGFGLPKPSASCPDREPETGWLSRDRHGRLVLEPFETLHNDAEGRAYAKSRGLEFPFSNDYFDAPTGSPQMIDIDPTTTCTGVILVGYREPLKDHVIDCAKLDDARHRLPVAIWRDRGSVVQVSELYRP